MYKNFFEGFLKFFLFMLLFFCAAYVAGAVCCGRAEVAENTEMSEFLTSFFSSVKSQDMKKSMIAGIYEYLKTFGVIFVCAFFKPGAVITSCVVMRQGFMSGYSMASFLKVFSKKGLLAMLAQLPETLVFILLLIVFSSTSTKFAFFTKENKKNFLILFMIFSCFFLSIFCVLGIFKGYLTTIFMKWAASKIL